MSTWLAAVALAVGILVVSRASAADRVRRMRDRAGALSSFELPSCGSQGSGSLSRSGVVGGAVLAGTAAAASDVPWPALLVLALTGIVALRWRRRLAAQRHRTAGRRAVVELTLALASELRGGRRPDEALASVAMVPGPLAAGAARAAAAVASGGSASAELAALSAQPGAEALADVAAVWEVTERSGAAVATVLDSLADTMDADDELALELDAALAGPRSTMLMLAALPVLGVVLGQAVGADPLHLLLHRPLGAALLAGAALLDGAGVALTRLIVATAMAP